MGVVLKLISQISLGYGIEMLISRQHCKSYSMYGVTFDGFADSGSVLEDTTSKTEAECSLWCSSFPACRSVNYRAADGRCQLIERGKRASAQFLVKKTGWKYVTTDDKHREAICYKHYYGENCEKIMKDCSSVYESGSKQDGVYNIKLNGSGIYMDVFCDMNDNKKGWIVIQRRVNDSLRFYRRWKPYKNGFGDLNGNMWIGLDKLHLLAGPGKKAILLVRIKHYSRPNKHFHAKYTTFEVGNEATKYKLLIGGYSGNAGDSMAYHNGMMFSTYDNDNDMWSEGNCAEQRKGGWWYNHCHKANLNGYFPNSFRKNRATSRNYMGWKQLTGSSGDNVFFSEMKIKYP